MSKLLPIINRNPNKKRSIVMDILLRSIKTSNKGEIKYEESIRRSDSDKRDDH